MEEVLWSIAPEVPFIVAGLIGLIGTFVFAATVEEKYASEWGNYMKWVTRKDIRVNRTATCWLVRRFIDAQAEFIFVDPAEVSSIQSQQRAIGFDAPNATYPHKNEKGLCSFAALVHERFSDNDVLLEMARIVQAADFKDQLDDHPAARGLQLISNGFPMVTNDDHDTVVRAAFVYDSLYASIEFNPTSQ